MIKNILLASTIALSSSAALSLKVGEPLPELSIPSKGELILEGSKVKYSEWNTKQLKAGVPAIIFHLPARMESQPIIDPLTAELEKYEFGDTLQALTIINLADALPFTSGIVASELKKNKKKHPESNIIADDKSRALAAWELEKRNVYVAVMNTEGSLIHLHEGPMSQEQITNIVEMTKAEAAKVAQPEETPKEDKDVPA